MLGNTSTPIQGGLNQTVCCGGRSHFGGGHAAFPWSNTCQIFTPDFVTPGNSTWQLCHAWGPVPGEDDNPGVDAYTHGRTEMAIAVTSDYKVLMFGGDIRMADNHTMATSNHVRMLDPALCGRGNEYTILDKTMLRPRDYAQIVALTNLDATGDTFLIIGGDNNGQSSYSTERVVWDPASDTIASGYPRCDADLPSQLVNGVRLPYNGAFFSQALLLSNGNVAYYGGSEVGSTQLLGSPYMLSIWEPGESVCP
jgi:hypothetical protein